MSSIKSTITLIVPISIWLAATGSGFFLLQAEHARPGRPGTPPVVWPEDSPIRPDPVKPTLLVFLHPRCPCSRASVTELASVLAALGDRFVAYAILYRPENPSEDWDRAGSAGVVDESVSGLRRWIDPRGKVGRRFGVETSGHVLLFNPAGQLLFSGGITPSRGHRGENPGLDALIAPIEGQGNGSERSPIFGCPTIDPDSTSRTEEIR